MKNLMEMKTISDKNQNIKKNQLSRRCFEFT